MMYIREQKKQLTIKSLKKVFLLTVLNVGLVLSIFNNQANAALPRATYNKCHYDVQSLLETTQFESTQNYIRTGQALYTLCTAYNSTTDIVSCQNRNSATNASSSNFNVFAYPCTDSMINTFDRVPLQDMFYQGLFILMFVIGVYFGYKFFKL